MGEVDPRLGWLEERLAATLRGVKPDRFRRLLATDAGRMVTDFLNVPEARRLFFIDSPIARELLVTDVPPVGKGLAGAQKFMYFIKSRPMVLTPDLMDKVVACGDVGGPPLEHLYKVCNDVFLPILSNPHSQGGWPDVISREVMGSFQELIASTYVTIGQSQGRTFLPLPPVDLSSTERVARNRESVRALEAAVAAWTRQIEHVLQSDPEAALKAGEHPGPLAEFEFWRGKASNLLSVQEQLQSDKVRKVVRVLELSKSGSYPAFHALAQEVATACAEARDNAKYLSTLEAAFSRMHACASFPKLSAEFRPLMHVTMLVWKHSKYYNSPARLAILVRKICNDLIWHARRYVDAASLFGLEPLEAVERISTALRVFAAFKAAYFEYKGRVASELPANPWGLPSTALFPRLDAFLERLHDLLDMSRTAMHFGRLERIEIGGNKGRTLSASVYQIYADFTKTLGDFRALPYDVLDVEQKGFDGEFYKFRGAIKALERRLVSVLSQGFEDCSTIFDAFKLIESFEGLLEREFIQADLERKHVELIQAYGKDLREVSELFARHRLKSAEGRYLERSGPPLFLNMPPCSGAIYWARGLIERIEQPMAKLRQMMRATLEADDGRAIVRQHAAVHASLAAFQQEQYAQWATSIDSVTYEKLKQPLLSRCAAAAAAGSSGPSPRSTRGAGRPGGRGQLLTVNFDPALICLLREVHYLARLGMPIPRAADELYRLGEAFRVQIGNLEMITGRYNVMLATMLDVEEPLLQAMLRQIDGALEKGLAQLTWRSHAVNDFIREVTVLVREAGDTLSTLKANMAAAEEILHGWSEQPMLRRKLAKTYAPAEFQEELEGHLALRYADMRDGGRELQKLLVASNRVLRISKGAPTWRTYVEYVNDVVIDGLARAVAESLRALCELVDVVEIARGETLPLLEVQLELAAPDVVFSPELGEAGGPGSIANRVQGWIKSFFKPCSLISRLDNSEGDLLKEVEENEDVRSYTHRIRQHIAANELECEAFCAPFLAHHELWTLDISTALAEFLALGNRQLAAAEAEAAEVAKAAAASDGTGGGGASARSGGGDGGGVASGALSLLAQPSAVIEAKLPTLARARLEPVLSDFDEQIAYYKAVQDEVTALPSSGNQGWLRIDAKPVKQALSTWVTKWMFAYTQHLQARVVSALAELTAFMREVNLGLKEPPEPGDVPSLIRAMGHVRSVRVCTDEVDGMFEPLKATVALLRRYGIALPESVSEQLEGAPFLWEDTKKATFNAREQLGPAQARHAERIKLRADSFGKRLRDFRARFAQEAPFEWARAAAEIGVSSDGQDVLDGAYASMDRLRAKIAEIEAEARALSEQEELFDLRVHSWKEIGQCLHELRWLKAIWDHASLVGNALAAWRATQWSAVRVDEMTHHARAMDAELCALERHVRGWGVYTGLVGLLREAAQSLPLVAALRDDAMRERHWMKLMRICGRAFAMGPKTPLDDLLRLRLPQHASAVAETVQQARDELKIDLKLAAIDATWAELELRYGVHMASNVPVVLPADAVYEALDEHELSLQSMMSSRYMGFFEGQIISWKLKLSAVRSTLDDWLEVQRQWCSLEPIFLGSEDIREQIPEDARRFSQVNADFREQMFDAMSTPSPIEACMREGRAATFAKCLTSLELCMRSLGEYLETKRRKFPRFYIIASADLVDILSKGANPPAIHGHFAKLTDSVATVQWRAGDDGGALPTALGTRSADGEAVTFRTPLQCDNMPPEEWLPLLVAHVAATLREQLARCIDALPATPRERWIFDYCAQLVTVASSAWWALDVARCFEKLEQGHEGALVDYLAASAANMAMLTGIVTRADISRGDRAKVVTLITVEVRARDVVQRLVSLGVDSPAAFVWQSQLRYRVDDKDRGVSAVIADAELKYCYEYVGNAGRLVITPLTDRCYMTLTQALKHVLGSVLAGPAGTGKTETVRDLGRNVAVWVVVVNCSDQISARVVSTLFAGLAQTGAWGCFDEVNRIAVEVLSIFAGQYASILDALRAKHETFSFNDETIRLVPTVGSFITLVPGASGRLGLPENLKVLHRPVAMIAPDARSIAEVTLAAAGFIDAQALGRKFVEVFRVSRELLTKQQHYDWGMRAMKSILRIAGKLMLAEAEKSEAQILMRALRDFNQPKLVFSDYAIFDGILEDLFPHVEYVSRESAELTDALHALLTEPGSRLQPENAFVSKCVALDEILAVRHSVFILGPAGSGKTSVWQTLNRAYTLMAHEQLPAGGAALATALNPKAVTPDELYGSVHPTTKVPSDGIFSRVMREYAAMDGDAPKWIVLDGDVDTGWVESMNTAMDDNRVITLVSSERIPITASMRLIFEASHLRNAAPATVSRAGVVFVNEVDIGWRPLVSSWVETVAHLQPRAALEALFDKLAVPALEQVRREHWMRTTPLADIAVMQALCTLLEALLLRTSAPGGGGDDPAGQETARTASDASSVDTPSAPAEDRELCEAYFKFATVWAVGGALVSDKAEDHRRAFSDWWRAALGGVGTVHIPEVAGCSSVFDYFVDPSAAAFVPWRQSVGPYAHVSDVTFANIVVPTVDTTRLAFLAETLMLQRKPMMLVGGAGTAKTTILSDALRSLPDDMMSFTINFNPYTDASALQANIEQALEKKTGFIYAPPGTKKLVYLLDDLNMPAPDQYGTQSAIELLRQQLDYGGFYDLRTLRMKQIQGTQHLAAMNPAAGSFAIADRMQRHFATFACPFPAATIAAVYSAIIGGHFASFPEEVGRLTEPIVAAALALHRELTDSFLPTVETSHYQWTLHELSRVFEGLCLATPESVPSSTLVARLWLHESRRVYGDRLISEPDRTRFNVMLNRVAKNFIEEFSQGEAHTEPLIFTTFTSSPRAADDGDAAGADGATRPLVQAATFGKLRKFLEAQLREHNELDARMDLVLFGDAVEHVCRIARIIDRPRGNAVLLGVGGSGRQSLTRLAAFIGGFEVLQVSPSDGYALPDFRTDLLSLYARTGLKGESVVLLLTDRQIVDERMLMYLNDFLSYGYVPDLYSPEEKDAIVSAVRDEVKAAGLLDTHRNCWEYFVDKVRANLHVVLCFSPVGDAFRVRCRKFPALTRCCTIDYFRPWPGDALISVAIRSLSDAEFGSDEVRENLAHHMAYVHECVSQQADVFSVQERRPTYVTPKSFLELIALYKSLVAKARAKIDTQISRLEQGLTKLRSTSLQVAAMDDQLREEQVDLEHKKLETDTLLIQVGEESAVSDEQAQLAAAEEKLVADMQSDVDALEAQCAAELAATEPVLKKAEHALATLDKKMIAELRAINSPSKDVSSVCQAVMYLTAKPNTNLRRIDISWVGLKKAIGPYEPFLSMLQAFDHENIPQENIDMVRKFTGPPERPDPSFQGDAMKSRSAAAACLCDWVCNMCAYHDMHTHIEPKRLSLLEAQAGLDDAKGKLAAVHEKLASLEGHRLLLQDQLVRATEAKNLQLEAAQRTAKRLNLAERLVNGLKDENEQWNAQITLLLEQKTQLIGDTMVAASFVSYAGPFNEAFRRQLVASQWVPDILERGIPMSMLEEGEMLDPVTIIAEPAQVAAWKSEKLPSDRLSVENGAIISACVRWPLLVDPQQQGSRWIRQHEEEAGIVVTQLTSRTYLDRVRRAMEDGTAVLIENVPETLDATLEPVLARATMRKGRKTVIRLGDRETDVLTAPAGGVGGGDGPGADVPLFRLYLQTRLPNPHFSPEIVAQTTLINFSVTDSGLQEQLLSIVVKREAAELEREQSQLATHQSSFGLSLKELEDDLLYQLANAEGDVLADEVLVESLEATQATVRNVKLKAAEAKETASTLSRAREAFRPVATRASLIYFLIDSLSVIDPMYQYSLSTYLAIFEKALDQAGSAGAAADGLVRTDDASAAKKRIDELLGSITYSLFAHVTRGLYERHRLVFATKLAIDVLCSSSELSAEDVELLVRPSKSVDSHNLHAQWLSDASWASLNALVEAKPSVFGALLRDMDDSWKRWKDWMDGETPELDPLPQEWKRLSSFNRLVLVRAFRPDRMYAATVAWVRECLGPRFGVAIPYDLEHSFAYASPTVPIFFLLSPGLDPKREVQKLAKKLQLHGGQLVAVSLGQGQETMAERALDRMHTRGGWVVLQNIELVTHWLPALERKLELLAEDAHASFRVFLTAMSGHGVPTSTMQNSIKLTHESPSGLKANMLRAFNTLSDDVWSNHQRQPELKAIAFSMCLFHSIACERRKFGPIGWSRRYPFSLSDLGMCVAVASAYLETSPAGVVPWEDLRYIFGEIMYGGHITDTWDRRLCSTYLSGLLTDELLEGATLAPPKFDAPPSSLAHAELMAYIEANLVTETPAVLGLHPSSEVLVLTRRTAELFDAIAELQPTAVATTSKTSMQETAKRLIDYVLERLPSAFSIADFQEHSTGEEHLDPFRNVLVQECARMNALLEEMRRSLAELDGGIKGELSMGELMESFVADLFNNRVPSSWAAISWPSLRPLSSWLTNVLERQAQLHEWSVEMVMPKAMWISGLFNPQAFLSAVLQLTARRNDWPLDELAIVADVTTKRVEEIDTASHEGSYVHGLFLEGARWDTEACCLGLDDAPSKELYPILPVVHIRAAAVADIKTDGLYECPVYKTLSRGATYVFSAGLRTNVPPSKWVLAGVAILMDVTERS